jgi:hypothetical protein
MKEFALILTGLLVSSTVWAENLSDTDELLCAVSRVMLCVENGECYEVQPWEADIPQFVHVDTQKMMISTTRASQDPRSTPITTYEREGGKIYLQGMQMGRAFSFVIDEATGLVTSAVARDGIAVSIFGACTNADVEPAS